jgi:hypothetical protein
MNTWYPDATAEELEATDNVCIICREEMIAPSTKKLPCNHIFHKNCLRLVLITAECSATLRYAARFHEKKFEKNLKKKCHKFFF